MAKQDKPKGNAVGTKVKNRGHHKKPAAPIDPLTKFKPEEQTAYSRYLLAENRLEDMKNNIMARNTNLPRLSYAVLGYVVEGEPIPIHYSDCPEREIEQFNAWCEPLVAQREKIARLAEKCKRILDSLK